MAKQNREDLLPVQLVAVLVALAVLGGMVLYGLTTGWIWVGGRRTAIGWTSRESNPQGFYFAVFVLGIAALMFLGAFVHLLRRFIAAERAYFQKRNE